MRSAFAEQELAIERVPARTCRLQPRCHTRKPSATPSECPHSSRKPQCCEYTTTMPGFYIFLRNSIFENAIYSDGSNSLLHHNNSTARSLPSVLLSTCSCMLTLSKLKSLCWDGANRPYTSIKSIKIGISFFFFFSSVDPLYVYSDKCYRNLNCPLLKFRKSTKG